MTEEQRAELEKLEKLARAFGDERWVAHGDEVRLVHGGGRVVMSLANPEGEFEDEHALRIAAFQAAANPATVLDLLATIARLEAENAAHRELTESAVEVQCRLNCDPAVQGREWRGVGVRFVNAINASRARLSSRAKDQSQ